MDTDLVPVSKLHTGERFTFRDMEYEVIECWKYGTRYVEDVLGAKEEFHKNVMVKVRR